MKAPASNPRLLLYSHDAYGLGHFRRNLTIAKRLATSDKNQFVEVAEDH